ncbi:uncharacterized protein LOC115762239 [Drosophila novamexicana]|uniref:uncharacterized protein LOC115762239 n=1 Tax=Drosophila novamexicana TaxID=47314 RepID=UPI0011E5BD0E|nr:uncharacterized protein LOC115762239 [Drosophila novamexicana]
MKLCILLVIAGLSLSWGWPAQLEQEQLQQAPVVQEPEPQQQLDNADSMATLTDIADMGSQHAEEGARNARFLWFSPWGYRSYYYRPYYHPWGHHYRHYWW